MITLIIYTILKILTIIVPLLISVAYFTIAERKIMGIIQRRRGPNVIGFIGLLQPLADGLKLFVKETILPSNSSIMVFLLAPILTFLLSLISWSVIPFSEQIVLSNWPCPCCAMCLARKASRKMKPGDRPGKLRMRCQN